MESAGAPPLETGDVTDPLKHAPPCIFYHVKFGRSGSKGVRVNRREPQRLGSAGPPLRLKSG